MKNHRNNTGAIETLTPSLRREISWESSLSEADEFKYERLVYIPLLVIPTVSSTVETTKESRAKMKLLAETVAKASIPEMPKTPPRRRRHSVTSLTPSPKNKPLSKKSLTRPEFFLSTIQTGDLLDAHLIRFLLQYLESTFPDAFNTVPLDREKLSAVLGKIGFSKEVITRCRKAFENLTEQYGLELVESCLLNEKMERVISALIEVQSEAYSEKLREYLRHESGSNDDDFVSSLMHLRTSRSKVATAGRRSQRATKRSQASAKSSSSSTNQTNTASSSTSSSEHSSDRSTQNSGDGGNDRRKPTKESQTTISKSQATETGPGWRKRIHTIAQNEGVSIRFSNNSTIPLRNNQFLKPSITKRSFYHCTKEHGMVRIFHGCRVKDDLYDIAGKLESFTRVGASIVLAKPKGYLSSGPAVYYSNSVDYAYCWTAITHGFAQFVTYERIVPDPVLIVCQSIEVKTTLENKEFNTWVIEQDRADLARIFANKNMNEKSPPDKRHPPPDSSEWEFDIITSPLPSFSQRDLFQSQHVGAEISQGIPISEIVVVGGCSPEGAEYLGSKERDIIVVNMGDGGMGKGFVESDFRTAGMGQTYMTEKLDG